MSILSVIKVRYKLATSVCLLSPASFRVSQPQVSMNIALLIEFSVNFLGEITEIGGSNKVG
jgi:hypothetical protein